MEAGVGSERKGKGRRIGERNSRGGMPRHCIPAAVLESASSQGQAEKQSSSYGSSRQSSRQLYLAVHSIST